MSSLWQCCKIHEHSLYTVLIVAETAQLPQDIHSGYGFAIGNVAAFDMGSALSVVRFQRGCQEVLPAA